MTYNSVDNICDILKHNCLHEEHEQCLSFSQQQNHHLYKLNTLCKYMHSIMSYVLS